MRMRKVLIIVALVLLLVSCIVEPNPGIIGNHIGLQNQTHETIYYNIRKASDPATIEFEKLTHYTLIYTDQATAYVVSYAIVTGKKTEIIDDKAVTVDVVSTGTIEITTTANYNDIIFKETSSGITWVIEH